MTVRSYPAPSTASYLPYGSYRTSDAARDWRGSLAIALSLRGMTLELWIIVAYLVVATVGDLNAAKLSVQVGAVPIFLTDITLLMLLVVSFARESARVLYWGSEGIGAGAVGRAVWILCILSVVYFVLAFPEYHLYAMRDLAIFGYALFFPLTWFAIRDGDDAAKLVRYLTYSGVILALIILFQGLIRGFGGHWDYGTAAPVAPPSNPLKRVVLGLINQDAGAFSVFALAALPAYMLFESQLRYFHTACAIACFFALAASTSRAGVVGLSVAFGITLLYAGPRYRGRCALFATFLVLAVALAPMLPLTMPGSRPLSNLRLAVLGAARGPSVDPTSQFRIIRWRYTFKRWLSHPIFGEGFGSTIIPYSLWETNERMGLFNRGMPHNTFLFVADRMGIVGLALVLFCWFLILRRLLAAFGQTRRADNLAAANILAAMFGFAIFVLFFERPVTNAAFWIVMAAGARLVEGQTGASAWTRRSGRHALRLHGA
jgi:O-antigen ligase